jgi:hypothetical protein
MTRPHELRTFFEQVTQEMAAEYRRIYARTHEDPGTAGDEGESNWSNLLSDWLPSDVHVVTKGRILGANGVASPQVDVVVLSGDYPRKLLGKEGVPGWWRGGCVRMQDHAAAASSSQAIC